MNIEQLRNVYNAQPFIMHPADGRNIPVRDREFLLPSPNGRFVIAYQHDDTFNIIDLLMVTDLEVTTNAASPESASRS